MLWPEKKTEHILTLLYEAVETGNFASPISALFESIGAEGSLVLTDKKRNLHSGFRIGDQKFYEEFLEYYQFKSPYWIGLSKSKERKPNLFARENYLYHGAKEFYYDFLQKYKFDGTLGILIAKGPYADVRLSIQFGKGAIAFAPNYFSQLSTISDHIFRALRLRYLIEQALIDTKALSTHKSLTSSELLKQNSSSNFDLSLLYRTQSSKFLSQSEWKSNPFAGLSPLTEMELKVAMALTNGANEKTVARKLSISINTLQSHRKSIYGKLDIKRRNELIYLVDKFNKRIGG